MLDFIKVACGAVLVAIVLPGERGNGGQVRHDDVAHLERVDGVSGVVQRPAFPKPEAATGIRPPDGNTRQRIDIAGDEQKIEPQQDSVSAKPCRLG